MLRLTLFQKLPNQSEITTVGVILKKIKRTDPEFKLFVKNENPDIVWKDEEHSGADRMMTPRLKEKLDALAILVKKEWPGTKLRVTEAWDENNEHHSTSLHYEGRAADITVFPLDSSRLGRLGALASHIFDWTFYENTAHVHVSVRRKNAKN